jgi:hypothetical protein
MRSLLPILIVAFAISACSSPEQPASAPVDTTAVLAAERPNAANPANFPQLEVPPGWNARFDHDETEYVIGSNADSSDVYFVTMTPGWHVTTKPAGIFWHPASTASGDWSVVSKIHLFQPGERNEGFGVFFGGTDLEGASQSYVYFLVRRTGEFLVKKRTGENTEPLIDWTANEAIVPYTDTTSGTAANTLKVTLSAGTIHFLVNDVEVGTLPAAGIVTDGIVGLRINHGLNLHVEEFAVEPAL